MSDQNPREQFKDEAARLIEHHLDPEPPEVIALTEALDKLWVETSERRLQNVQSNHTQYLTGIVHRLRKMLKHNTTKIAGEEGEHFYISAVVVKREKERIQKFIDPEAVETPAE